MKLQQALIRTILTDYTLAEMKTNVCAMCNQMHRSSGTEHHRESLCSSNQVEPVCSYGDSFNVIYSRNAYSQNKSEWKKKSHNTGQYGYNNCNSPSRVSGGRRANPLDANGKPLKHYSCGSIMHI